MPHSKIKNQKGFTLIEILLVILLMGILGVTALQSYYNTSDTFEFLDKQKDVLNTIRQARSYAINNKEMTGNPCNADDGAEESASGYGVEIRANKVTFFADVCTRTMYRYFEGIDKKINEINFEEPYRLSVQDSDEDLPLPVTFTYDRITGEMTVTKAQGVIVDKRTEKFINIRLTGPKSIQSNIQIMQVSGIPEIINEVR